MHSRYGKTVSTALLECRDESRKDNKFLGIHVIKTGKAPLQYARVRCEELLEGLSPPGPSSWRDLYFRQMSDSGFDRVLTHHIVLRCLCCQEDKYATDRIVHYRVLPDDNVEAKEVHLRKAAITNPETPSPQPTILRLRSVRGRLLDQHVIAVSLTRQSDLSRLLFMIGISNDFDLSLAVNPPSLERVNIENLSLTHIVSAITGSARVALTTEDGDHLMTSARVIVERHRENAAIDLHIWRGDAVCAEHPEYRLPATGVESIST